ncbi:MAG: ABC transporter ATP-binding protein [Desulfoprunum sp.]|nr:ABC transporter ATP-binding protein [Desulfoprunum sp.]
MGAVVLRDIEKLYGDTIACTDINLSINEGEFFTFLGPSGCGKTTILRLIAGFVQPKKGTIHLGRRDITNLEAEKRQVGMVFQNYALFPFMTVAGNIEYGLKIQKKSKKERAERVEKYTEMVGLIGFEHRNISELSGGEQQRVALARSLAIEPKVLLLDEPLSNLDARLRDRMRSELKSLQKKLGITTIFVTHDQTEALTMSDRVAVFEKGRCIQVGSPEEIYAHPINSFVARFIGDTNLFAADIKNGTASLSDMVAISLETQASGRFISIRPQDIVFSTAQDDRPNVFPAKVDTIQFDGSSVEYSVKVHDISFRLTILNTSTLCHNITVGEDVHIAIAEKSIKVLDS